MTRKIILCGLLMLLVPGVLVGAFLVRTYGIVQDVVPTSTPPPQVVPLKREQAARPDFQRGMADVAWIPEGYSRSNTAFQQTLQDIYPESGATWLSLQVSFTQETASSTTISAGSPSLASFTEGIQAARAAGYHLFFEPLIRVTATADHWGGHIQPQSVGVEAVWFQRWYAAIAPYIMVAQKLGVEQVAIGTELEWLQVHAKACLWNHLIAQVHSIFKGTIIYDANWNIVYAISHLPSWFKNTSLYALGVSEYIPLTATSEFLTQEQASALWETKVHQPLDRIAHAIGKGIILSEFGYRNSSDAGYQPYRWLSSLPESGQEQAILFAVSMPRIMTDQDIIGVFLWCWSNAARFSLRGQPALAVIHSWYTS
jgi:hypothetical protein